MGRSLPWRTPKLFCYKRRLRSRPTERRKLTKHDFKPKSKKRSSASLRRKQGPRRRGVSVKLKLRSEDNSWRTQELRRPVSRQNSKQRKKAKLRRMHGFKRRSKLRNNANGWKKSKSSRGFGQRS